ncbi:TIR domain-containing protein [Nocardia asteroides]|uniref:TIR domain-containing protein n=1 Tax=Nocardia asteroides TaxID=1824 RepID=UPI001E45FD61|nr:nucleotide-binding protein [Nocardia asteroides]UGT53349.1 nucleotide-binding protein [Nocardia asteroides]
MTVPPDPTLAGTRELAEAAAADNRADSRKVFVIHGRNNKARQEVFAFLRAIGLRPIEWANAVAMTGEASPYIGDVLAEAFTMAQAIVVLQTPDDIVHLDTELCGDDDDEARPQWQPRPNVLFEAGMAMAVSPKRTVIVEFGQVKPFSDISGRHRLRLDNSTGKRQEFANRLRTAGCDVDLEGTDWHSAGDLTPPAVGLPRGKKFPKSTEPTEPVLDGRYIDRGSRKFGAIEVINRGPGAVRDLNVDLSEASSARLRDEGFLPVPHLPAGKSVVVLNYEPVLAMGEKSSTHLTFPVIAKTEDGREFRQEIFVSLGA